MVTELAKLRRELHDQEVLQSELESLKPNKKVYSRLPNSDGHICFISSKAKVLSNCKESQEKLRKQIIDEQKQQVASSNAIVKPKASPS